MNKAELIELIKKGEGERLEFKSSSSEWREIIETISAFSNTSGGKIVVGVSNNGNIIGVKIGKGTLEELASKIRDNTEPIVLPSLGTVPADLGNVIVVDVTESGLKPTFAFGKPFKRVGRSNHKMSYDDAFHLYLESRGKSWDELTRRLYSW